MASEYLRSVLTVAALTGGLAACSPFSDTPPPATSIGLPESPQNFAVRAEDEPGLVDDNWVASFDDQKLNALVSEAMTNNLSLKGTAAKVREAEARARRAGAELSPEVDLSGSGGRGGPLQDTATGSFDLGLQASWELDVWNRLGNEAQAATLDAIAARADYRGARLSLAGQVATSWFVLLGDARQVELDERNLQTQLQAYNVVDARVETGLVMPLDRNVAQADVARAREQLAQSKGAFDDAARSLEIVLGRYPSAEIEAAKKLTEVPPPTPAGLPSELLERRPDIVAADRRVAAAYNRTAAAKAARLPQFSLTANIGGTSQNLKDVLDPINIAWNFAGNIFMPVFDGGRLETEAEISTALQEEALASYADLALNAFGEVETALANEGVLRTQEEQLKITVQQLSEAENITMARYREGQVNYLDVNQVRQERISAEKQHLGLQVERLKQRVQLHLVLGGSFKEDEPPASDLPKPGMDSEKSGEPAAPAA
ncbi:MAG: TolC family protein [Geminicoccaceae bacterium]|nr:TolC family protein [Geminicoccaceae bacterium]MCB9942896.1 TolC family protein [Geminicoccaceae bacterium]